VLFADTLNRFFEREAIEAAIAVLDAAGYRVRLPRPAGGERRPLCCGRSYLSTGEVEQARREAERALTALAPYAERGTPIIGLEPSCLLAFRDEIPGLAKSELARRVGAQALIFEEFLTREAEAGRLKLELAPSPRKALLHTHCHQKAFGLEGVVKQALALVPGLEVEAVASSCCGMAGSFGYQTETSAISKAMAELSLLPVVRAANEDTIIVADGFSCRHQIADLGKRHAVHVAQVLAGQLA
jgi:Fe-S oxidoreductase